MCNPNGSSSEMFLNSYNSIGSNGKRHYIGPSTVIVDPTEISSITRRKRKGAFDTVQFKNFKVRRKSVDKIHLQMEPIDLSMLSTEPQIQPVETTIFAEDDDTEKYLTNSSKRKNKQQKDIESRIDAETVPTDSNNPMPVFESTDVQVVTDDYGELVVTLYPSSDSTNDINVKEDHRQQIPVTSHQGSYIKQTQPPTIFISQDFSTTSEADATQCIATSVADSLGHHKLPNATKPTTVAIVTNDHHLSTEEKLKNRNNNHSTAVESNKDPVRNVWVTMKSHKEQLKQGGHNWTTGTWSNEEVEILKNNIERYSQDHRIENLEDLIFSSAKDTRKDFYPSLCTGLNRPLFAVYRRVKRMYNKQKIGKYTTEEVDKLKQLRNIHGHNWSLIGQELGRSSDSVKDRCRLIKEDLITGRWTKQEEDRLAEAVHLVSNTRMGESITEGISWGSVANMVKTRTEKQCRSKWLNYLNWKTMHGEPWSKTDDKLLVDKVAKMDVPSENEVDWSKLCVGWTSARSPQWLRWKWNNLKKQLSDLDVDNLSFKQSIEILTKFYSEQVLSGWEKPSQLIKFLNLKQPQQLTAEDMNRLQMKGIRILSKEDLDMDDSSNITTSVVSQSEDTTSAPLFIQTDDDTEHLVSPHIVDTSSPDTPFRFRIASDSANDSNKEDFSCEPQLSGATYHLAATSAEGIYIIETSSAPDEVATLATDDDRYVNITLAPEVLSSMFKLNGAKLQTEDAVTSSESDVTFDPNVGSVYLSHSRDSPVLEGVGSDVTIGSPNEDDDVPMVLLRDTHPLSGSYL